MAIKHYEGKLGTFDYDDTAFIVVNGYDSYGNYGIHLEDRDYLFYIGTEVYGQNINIPEGLLSIDQMFYNEEFCPVYNKLLTMPKIPDSVISCENVFSEALPHYLWKKFQENIREHENKIVLRENESDFLQEDKEDL